MTRHSPGRRAGFTLVELLVVMAVIVVLATITVAVVPSAMEQDRTTDAASTIRQHLMIAKARATRESNGRGIRFILDGGLQDPVRLSAGAPNAPGGFLSTEMQYIEAAPILVPNPLGLTGANDPFVEFDPTTSSCTLFNLPATHEAIVVMNNDLGARWFPKLNCPVLGPDAFGRPQRFAVTALTAHPKTANAWVVTLDRQPHSLLGAGTTQRVYRFAVEPRSRPILGEPNVPLPKNVCVDLNAFVSVPGASSTGSGLPIDFEIMFAPNGQVIDPVSSGLIYLWVRDYTKTNPNTGAPLDMRPTLPNAGSPAAAYDYGSQFQFEIGGEQQLVALKAKTGALGVFPINWPNATGIYAAGLGPHSLAAKEASSP